MFFEFGIAPIDHQCQHAFDEAVELLGSTRTKSDRLRFGR
jgi:hypothetical protein